MKRLRRILLNAASVVSLLLFVVTVGLIVDGIGPGRAVERQGAESMLRVWPNRAAVRVAYYTIVPVPVPDGYFEETFTLPGLEVGEASMLYGGGGPTLRSWSGTYVQVGYPLLLIAASAIPLARVIRRARRRARPRPGMCPACGYDLRATPDRCPECGHQPSS